MRGYLVRVEETARTVKPILKGEFGTEQFMIFNGYRMEEGKVYDFEAEKQKYSMRVIVSANEVEDEEFYKKYGPKPKISLKEFLTEVSDFCGIPMQNLVQAYKILLGEDAKLLAVVPASTRYHDCDDGGLVRHLYKMFKLTKAICDLDMWQIDKVLAVCGILFHDIGKVKSYTKESGKWENSDVAKYMGHHLSMSIELFSKHGQEVMELFGRPELYVDVFHSIGASHGQVSYGFGSIVDPQSTEAWLLHMCDMGDSRFEEV